MQLRAERRAFLDRQGPLAVIAMDQGAWAGSATFDASLPEMDGKRTVAYEYDSPGGETLTVKAENAPGFQMVVEIVNAEQRAVSRVLNKDATHVSADLDPGRYTVFFIARSTNWSGTAALSAAVGPRQKQTLDSGPVRQGFLSHPILMEQMTAAQPGLKEWNIRHQFMSIGPKVDGLPARVFTQRVTKGETIILTMDPAEIAMEVYDEKYNRLDEAGTVQGRRIVHARATAAIYILVLAPKQKYARAFTISRVLK
jgi:hypothetical protein